MDYITTKLKAARLLKGYSAEEVARRAGMDMHAYWRLESGKSQLKVKQLVKLAKVLDQQIPYFLDVAEPASEVKQKTNELKLLLSKLQNDALAPYYELEHVLNKLT